MTVSESLKRIIVGTFPEAAFFSEANPSLVNSASQYRRPYMTPELNHTSKVTPSMTGDAWRTDVQHATHTTTYSCLGVDSKAGLSRSQLWAYAEP